MRLPIESLTETITPHFKQGDYDGGVEAGIDQMISVVNGEPLPAPDRKWERHGGLGNALPLLLVVVFVVSGVLRAIFGRLFGSVATGGLTARHRLDLEPRDSHRHRRRRAGVLVRAAHGRFALRVVDWRAAGAAAWEVLEADLGGGFGGGGFGGGGGGGGFSGGGGGFSGGGASGSW